MTDEIRKEKKEMIVSVLNDMKLSRKKGLDKYLDQLYGERSLDFRTGVTAAFEYMWDDIERTVKHTMGIS